MRVPQQEVPKVGFFGRQKAQPTPGIPPQQDINTQAPAPKDPNSGKCPYPTHKLISTALKLGEKISNNKLRPYQVPFARRIVESIFIEDVATITGLFSRQCVDPKTMVLTQSGPRYIKDISPSSIGNPEGDEILSCDIKDPSSTRLLSHKVTPPRRTFNLQLHNRIPLTLAENHLVKLSSNKWGMIADGSLSPNSEVQAFVSLLYDADPQDNTSVRAFYAAQVMMNKRKPYIGAENRVILSVPHSIVNEVEDLLRVDFNRTIDSCIYPVDLPMPKVEELVAEAFVNTRSVMSWLMKNARLSTARNNRKIVPVVYLDVHSEGFWLDTLIYFFRHHGLNPRVSMKDRGSILTFDGFENLQRLELFFTQDTQYPELKEYVDHYYLREGYKLSPHDFMKVIRKYPHMKTLIKTSTYHHYRENGILLCVLLNLCKRIGVSESDLALQEGGPLLPSVCFAPVRKIEVGDTMELVDLEVSSGQFFGNAILQHNSGKTEVLAVICAALMVLLPYLHSLYPQDTRFKKFRDGFWIGIFAPSKEQSKTMYSRIRDRINTRHGKVMLKEFGVDFEVNTGDTVRTSNGSLTRCHTAAEESHIESKTYHLLVIEEAQDVSPFKIRKSIAPMGSDTAATMVMIGTCNTEANNDLYENQRVNIKEQKLTGIQNHFEVDHEEVSLHVPAYKKYVAKMKMKLGEDSDEFQMSYNNKWCFERGMAFTEEQLDYRTAENPKGIYLPDWEVGGHYDGYNPVYAGIDVGKAQDSTVVTAVEVDYHNPIETIAGYFYRKRVIGWLELVGDNFDDQLGDIIRFLHAMRVSTVMVDVTGKGDVLFDFLKAATPDIDCQPMHFSLPTKDKIYKTLINDVQSGRLTVPCGPETKNSKQFENFHHQMRTLVKSYKSNYMSCSKPDDKVDGITPHDDYPDSLALACYLARSEEVYEVEAEESPFERTGRNEFIRGN